MLIRFGGEGSTVWSQTNSQIHLGNILLNQSTIQCTGYSCPIELSILLQPRVLRAYLLRQMCKSAQTATKIILFYHLIAPMEGIKFSFFPNVFLNQFKVKDDPGKIQNHNNVFVYLANSLGSSRTSPIQKMVLFTEVTLHSTLLLTFGPKLFFFISSTSLEVLFHFQNMFEA